MRNKKLFYNYYMSQWEQPIRFLIKPGYGITFWKWCMVYIPITKIWIGKYCNFGYNVFHNGRGFELFIKNIITVRICTHGKIGWWYKKGLIELRLFGKEIIKY